MEITVKIRFDPASGAVQVSGLSVAERAFSPTGDVTEREALADLGPLGRLTPTEIRVLRLVAAGMKYRDVSAALCLSAGTIRTHMWNVISKLDVPNSRMAAALALAYGVITPADLLAVWAEHRPQMVVDRE